MARGYPKFLYSKVENAVDNGHYVVHTLFPRVLFRVNKEGNVFTIEHLAIWDMSDIEITEELIFLMKLNVNKWLKSQKHIVW